MDPATAGRCRRSPQPTPARNGGRYPDRVTEIIVDLEPVLKARYVYAPLLVDDALFATMRINDDGNALRFANGLEISAMWIERLPDQ